MNIEQNQFNTNKNSKIFICIQNAFIFLVKRAQIVEGNGITASSNFYVTLKLQNVKSTTFTAKGPQPYWDQEFLL